MRYLLLIWLFICTNPTFAQKNTLLSGTVKSADEQLLSHTGVEVAGTKIFTHANGQGKFSLNVPSDRITLTFTHPGYKSLTIELDLSEVTSYTRDIIMYPVTLSLDEVSITDKKLAVNNTIFIDPVSSQLLPSPSGNFEAILKTIQGVSVNNELSSQYSVRGGNFDDNLVYINDIEIYRPFLVHNGQQEGLSIINPELIGNVRFSAGGFGAKYGDKLSSVLDIKYSKPDSSELNASAGILGYSATLKYLNKTGSSYLLAGVRQSQTDRY